MPNPWGATRRCFSPPTEGGIPNHEDRRSTSRQGELTGGEYILLKKWFSYDNPLNIEARELKDPGGDAGDLTSSLPPPSCGMVEAEIRGRVSAIERRDQHTYFKFEVKNEIIDLMFKYIQDSLNG